MKPLLLAVHSHWVTIIGFLAAAFTSTSLLPQVVKTLKTKETKDISLIMFIMSATGLSLWFIYGLLLGDLPIIFANGFTLVLALVVLFLKIKYG